MNKLKSFSSTQDIQLYQEIKLLPAGSVFPFAKNNLLNLTTSTSSLMMKFLFFDKKSTLIKQINKFQITENDQKMRPILGHITNM